MFDWLVVILIIAGAFIVFKVVRASSKPKPEPMPATGRSGRTTPIPDQTKPPKRKSDNFNAVVFVAGNYPCEAASRFHRKTLEVREGVDVPLAECDRETCTCRLQQISNRRHGMRRVIRDRRDDIRFADDRRKAEDRREENNAWTRGKG